jgi:hypothetical protein
MDVMQESYNALEKTVTKRCKLTWVKSWFAVAIRR